MYAEATQCTLISRAKRDSGGGGGGVGVGVGRGKRGVGGRSSFIFRGDAAFTHSNAAARG